MALYAYNTTWVVGSGFTVALFKAAATSFEAVLTNLGWVQTSDTGQLVISGIAALPGNGSSSGYQIWRMDDSLQATYPVFIRVDFYQNAASSFNPNITIGSGSDGAGALTGNTSTRMYLGPTTTSTTSSTGWASGGPNRITICHAHDNGGHGWFNLERLKDSSGNDTGEGVSIIRGNASSSYTQQVWYPSGANNTFTLSGPGCLATNSSATAANGSDIYVFPCFPVGRGSHNQIIGVLAYYNVDLTSNNPVTLNVYGTDETYWPMGIASGSTMGVLAGLCPLIRRN